MSFDSDAKSNAKSNDPNLPSYSVIQPSQAKNV